MRKGLLVLMCMLIVGCQPTSSILSIQNTYGYYLYNELYYVGISSHLLPDTIEHQMNENTNITIENGLFQFQDKIYNQVTYIEDKLNNEEIQLDFIKKYKVCNNDRDTNYRIYINEQKAYVGVYYNGQFLMYIIELTSL